MSPVNIFNGIAVAAVSLAHLLAGFLVRDLGSVHARLLSEMGCALPFMLSRLVVQYTATLAPSVVGLSFGFLSAVALGSVARSERGRPYLPILLTISFIAVLLHLVIVWFGTALPLLGELR